MNKILSVLFSTFCWCFRFSRCIELDNLVSVVILYRHGDRTPVEPYPNDPYRNMSFWPDGFGQLTNRGKYHQYQMGQWLRTRYDGFIPEKYSTYDVYIRSTDVDRTLMSAEANLAGLYPPLESQTWNPNLRWQPIPIHTEPVDEDAVLNTIMICPRYGELQKELFKSAYFRNITHKLHDLYAYLTRYAGSVVSDLKHLEYIYNTLLIEDGVNYTLPDWTRSIYPSKLKPWAALSFATECYTTELARLKTGPFFNEIIKHFQNITSHYPETHHKIRIYSAHDTTIANVLNAMNLFQYHSPPFCSTILFELRRKNDGYYVNIFYKNTSVPQNMTLDGCDFDCDLDKFVKLLKPVTLDLQEWHKECLTGFRRFLHSNSLLVTVMVGLWIAVIALVIGLYIVAKYFENKDGEMAYQQIPNEEIS